MMHPEDMPIVMNLTTKAADTALNLHRQDMADIVKS
jgi:hypothetical protein